MAEEVLMPADTVAEVGVSGMEDLRALADRFKVTPSAMVMRARRLHLITPESANDYLDALASEFRQRPKPRLGRSHPLNAVRPEL
nr:hypothetical protein [Ornithinimicrobium pratense]